MKVIVDTSIWSLAFRRKQPDPKINQSLSELIQDQRIIMIGPIKQEVLSAYSDFKKSNFTVIP